MADAAAAQVIEIARVYPAPREAVWAAWTDPAQIARWWGKRGWSTPPESVAIELRPGGVFRLDSVSEADGTAWSSRPRGWSSPRTTRSPR